MPVEYFLRYNGQCYDIGTKLRFKPLSWGDTKEGTIEWISHNIIYIRLVDGTGWELSKICGLEKMITEIIEPVYSIEPPKVPVRGGPLPPADDMFIGWVWYIVIMLVGVIFKDRLMIWIFATAVFFLWKNGYLNGGKK